MDSDINNQAISIVKKQLKRSKLHAVPKDEYIAMFQWIAEKAGVTKLIELKRTDIDKIVENTKELSITRISKINYMYSFLEDFRKKRISKPSELPPIEMACPGCNQPVCLGERPKDMKGTGKAYACQKCNSYRVGSHRGDGWPLGSLVDRKTASLRIAVKWIFNKVGDQYQLKKSQRYLFLQKLLEIPPHKAHFSRFNKEECLLARERLNDENLVKSVISSIQ